MLQLRKLVFVLLTSCILYADVYGSPTGSGNKIDQNEMMPPPPSVRPKDQKVTLPEQIVLTLTMANETIRLNLKRNRNIPTDSPVIVARNGTYSNWTEGSKEFSVYYEKNSSASIVIEMKKENNITTMRCRGTLSVKGKFYSVYPLESRNLAYSENSTQGEFLIKIDGVDHAMKLEDAKLDFHEVINKVSGKPSLKEMFAADAVHDWPSGFQRYVVEMFIFIDYALYYRWYSRSQAIDHWGREYDAIQNLKYYFVHVANGVDMRYSSIRRPDFSINVRLVGLYIATNPSDSIWTERSDLTLNYGSEKYVEMYKALTAFEEWLPSKILDLGVTFDQATLFSGNKLYDGYFCSGGAPCTKSGLADIESICELNGPRSRAASINREAGMYASIQTAAHELGHNLGAQHDGTGNSCSGKDQYVMASAPSTLTPNNFNNAFTFSSCSIDQFRNYLAKVTMRGKGNCLLVGSSAPTVVVPPNFAAFPGMQYTADQQCQNIYGSSSYYCAGGSHDQTICQVMECWVPEKRACAFSAEQRAYDGTKCGNRKWCLNGQCAFDPRAIYTPDTCVYGDYKDQVDLGSGIRMSCYDMGRLQPYKCYEDRIFSDCCGTCAKIRDNNKPAGCGFGDKDPAFCQSSKKSYCYTASFNDTCCDSCLRQRATKTGCEYGDKAEWCSTAGSQACYGSADQCCGMCQRFYNGNYPGCEYGDKAAWCSQTELSAEVCRGNTGPLCCSSCRKYLVDTNPPNQPSMNCPMGDTASNCGSIKPDYCYSSVSSCCSTCSRLRTGIAGCEYGDKVDWCSWYVKGPAECQRREVADLCCQRCSQYKACSDSAPWCSSIFPGQCYEPQTASTCCGTCSRYKRSNPNCLYGNRYDWCGAKHCSTKQADCCASCS